MKARQCWTVLADKAQDQCERIQTELHNLQHRLQSLQSSEQRLRQLHGEYLARSNTLGVQQTGMQDAVNQRHFMQQLTNLMNKVAQDQHQTREAMAYTRERMAQAERERLKMQALVEQDLRQQQAQAQKLEQKQMDELGLRQFNLRHAHGSAGA